MYLILDLIYVLDYYFFIKIADRDSLKSIKSLKRISKVHSLECYSSHNSYIKLHYDLPYWYKVALNIYDKHHHCLPWLKNKDSEIKELYCQKFHLLETSTTSLSKRIYLDCNFLDKFYLNFDEKIIYLDVKILAYGAEYEMKRVIKRKNDFTFEIIFLQNQNLYRIDDLKMIIETNLYKDLGVNIAYTSHNVFCYNNGLIDFSR